MKYFLLSVFLVFSVVSSAQTYHFKNFSINDGLPQSTVYSVWEDSRGFVWMGTEGGGAFRFDGQNGITFNRSNGLSGNIVRSIFEDSKGRIWFGTDKGITLYDGYDFIKLDNQEIFPQSTVLKIIESSSGSIWVATNEEGVYEIKNNADSLTATNYSIKDGLISYFAFDILEDHLNRIWLAMPGGISIIEFDTDTTITRLSGAYDLPDNFIISLGMDSENKIWLGTYNSGAHFIKNTENLNKLDYQQPNNIGLQSGTVWDILCDEDKNTWFATDKFGVVKLSKNQQSITFNNQNGLLSDQVLCLHKDRRKNLWIGTIGHGAQMYAGNQFITFTTTDGLQSNNVTAFANDKKQALFVGSDKGLMKFNIENNSITNPKVISADKSIKCLAVATDSTLYFASGSTLYKVVNNKISTLHNFTDENLIINHITVDSKNNIWVATNSGYFKFFENSNYNFNEDDGLINNEVQYIIQDKDLNIWLATLGGLVRINGENYTDFNEVEGLNNIRLHTMCEDNEGNIWLGSFGGGLFKFDKSSDSIPISLIADNNILTSNNIYALNFINDSILLVASDKGFDRLSFDKDKNLINNVKFYQNEGYLPGENNMNALCVLNANEVLLGTANGIAKITSTQSEPAQKNVFITDIKLFFNAVNWDSKTENIVPFFNIPSALILNYNENHLTFTNKVLDFESPNQTSYSYRLKGQNENWSPFIKNNEQIFSSIKPGVYTYQVRAKDKFGSITNQSDFTFKITPPFWQTLWFYAFAIVFGIALIVLYIKWREQKLQKEKIILEKTVKERTAEVVKQRDEIEHQKEDITASINYAKRIQTALLPDEQKKSFENIESFVLFKPLDIVSGDFYWIDHVDEYSIYIAADSTGHGVPGAFMSMLGISFLNEIILNKNITKPNLILNELRKMVKFALKQQGLEGEAKDGMDIAACAINRKTLVMEYAGAYNPVYIYRKNENEFELNEIKADRMPIGIHIKEKDCFTNNEFQLQHGDSLYIFSDGYVDQFGGIKGGKFKTKNFKILLSEIQTLSLTEQKEKLGENIIEWMGEQRQIDDIVIVGIKC